MRLTLKTLLAVSMLATLFSCSGNKISFEEDDELETDGMELATRQEFLMTRDLRLNDVPKDRLLAARQKLQDMVSTARMEALAWQERGPNNIGGRTRAIVVDSRDATGNTVLAASVSGGIFRTTNFMSATPTWVPVNDRMLNLAVTAMKQDRTNPAVMYAGTGEGWFNVDAVRGAGIFKSTDGGLNWNQLTSTASFEYVQDVDVDKNGYVYASLRNLNTTNRGVVRSTDGGTTWVQVLGMPLPNFSTGRAADLEVAPNGDVYATLGIFSKTMVMKSSFSINGSSTGALGKWIEITPQHSAPTQRGELAIAPSNSNRLYLMMQDSASSQVKFIYRSNDAGVTWDSLPAPSSALNNGDNSQTWYNLIAAVDPTNQDVLYVGGLYLARSTDGGSNWTNALASSGLHVDQHELVYFASDKLYVGNDGGVYATTAPLAGTPTFTNKNHTYNVTQFYAVDYHPTTANYFLAGAQDNNTQKFTQAGMNTTTPAVGGDGGFPHIDKTDPNLQIAATTSNNYWRSTNGGASWSYLSAVANNSGQFINPTDFDDAANILYCGHDKGKYYVITGLDAAVSGTAIALPDLGTREVTAVRVDPSAPATIWLGASLNDNVPKIVKISNATTTPVTQASGTLGGQANAYISSIDIDPANKDHILATISNYGAPSVYESTNGGQTWTNVEGNLPDMPVRWGLFLPAGASVDGTTGGGILLGTELGVWYAAQTSGTATSWTPQNANLPNVRVDMLRYRPSDNLLLAATHGRGLFSTNLTSVSTGVPSVPDTKEFIRYISATEQDLLIKVGNLTTTKMQVNIYDLNGRLVSASSTRYADQRIDLRRLARGSYILKIYGNKQERYTRQFVK